MSEFVLRSAHIREGKFVPDRGEESVVVDWAALVERFSPARTRAGAMLLRSIRPGMFIGTRRRGSEVATFYFDAAGRSRNAAHILKQDPLFEESVIEVVYVDSVDWGMKLQELGAA